LADVFRVTRPRWCVRAHVAVSGAGLVAITGFLFILFNRVNWQKKYVYACDIVGWLVIYMVRGLEGSAVAVWSVNS